MRAFEEIYAVAVERRGGTEALEVALARYPSKSPAELAAIPDDRWLAEMTRGVFRAGFNWRVIDNKWPGFETAFHAFDPPLNAAMSEEEFDAHLKDTRIIRNGAKIAAVRGNAQLLVDLAREGGSAARVFADWPDADFVGLLEMMKKRAARLSGETAMRFFRGMGKPSFITTRDVAAALVGAGVLDKSARRQEGDMQTVQEGLQTSGQPNLAAI